MRGIVVGQRFGAVVIHDSQVIQSILRIIPKYLISPCLIMLSIIDRNVPIRRRWGRSLPLAVQSGYAMDVGLSEACNARTCIGVHDRCSAIVVVQTKRVTNLVG